MYSSNDLRNIGTPESTRSGRERKMIVIVRKFRSGASNDTQPTDGEFRKEMAVHLAQ